MNDFLRIQEEMTVTPIGQKAVGLRGTEVQKGRKVRVTRVFEDEGKPHLNLAGIRDAFLACQFMEVTKEEAVPA